MKVVKTSLTFILVIDKLLNTEFDVTVCKFNAFIKFINKLPCWKHDGV